MSAADPGGPWYETDVDNDVTVPASSALVLRTILQRVPEIGGWSVEGFTETTIVVARSATSSVYYVVFSVISATLFFAGVLIAFHGHSRLNDFATLRIMVGQDLVFLAMLPFLVAARFQSVSRFVIELDADDNATHIHIEGPSDGGFMGWFSKVLFTLRAVSATGSD